MRRTLSAALAALVALVAVPAAAADLAAEKVVVVRKNPLGRCSYINNIWIWGDPTDCPDDETVPLCDAKNVVAAALRFANRAEKAYRVPRVKELVPVRELGQPVPNPSELARRYCEARVLLDTGHHASAYYVLEEDSGFVGLSWSVFLCIDGYDAWRVYDGRCRVARPAPAQ